MTNRTTIEYLHDVVKEARLAIQFLGLMSVAELENDARTSYAVLRAIEIIGEACNHITPAVQTRYPGIDWRSIIGMRNILVHNYTTVDMTIVHNAVTRELPALIMAVEAVLRDLSP